MKKKGTIIYECILALLIILCILLPSLVGQTTVEVPSNIGEDGYPATDKTFDDLEKPGTRFGIVTGSDWVYSVMGRYPEGEIVYFDSISDIYTALENGKIDAGMTFLDLQDSIYKSHPTLAFIEEPFSIIDFGFGFQKNPKGEALCDIFSSFTEELKASGKYDELYAKWHAPDRKGNVMEKYSFSGENGTLIIATDGTWTPMSFYEGKTLTGLFVELCNAFCAESGYIPEYETVAASSAITGLVSGQNDIVADSVLFTDERMESVNISSPLMTDTMYLLVKADTKKEQVWGFTTFISSIKQSFHRTFIAEGRYRLLLSGFLVTIALSVIAAICGTILGGIICFLRIRKNPWVEALASLYIRIFRGIPIVVLLLVFYYIVFKNTSLTAFWVSAIAFTIDFSAYSSEIFRSGIGAVPEGQAKAARALGFNRINTFSKVIWPQALVHILPVYSGQIVATVKITSIAGYIAVIDLTKAANLIRSRTYDPYFPLLSITLAYLVLSGLLVYFLKRLEKKIQPGSKKIPGTILKAVEAYDDEAYEASRSGEASLGHQDLQENYQLIKVEHLKKSFGTVTPISDLSCDVYAGDVIAIVGPSGTGKSTFLYLINHLEKADDGKIIFEGEDTTGKGYDHNLMRQKIGMVFQSFNLFTHLTVIENLTLAQTELLGKSVDEACEKGMALLKMVGLTDKALSYPDQLSGGQQQRVAIIRALAMNPHLLLFDEPTSALDPSMVDEVLNVIRKLARLGITMMIVTHEMQFARNVSNRVFYLDEGCIYEEGSPDQIFTDPQRARTRQFINQLKVLEYVAKADTRSMQTLILKIEQYGFRHMISRRIINKVLTVIEELCLITILPTLDEDEEIRFMLEYSETKGIHMTISYAGQDRNPLEEADPLSLKLLRYGSQDISYQYSNGSCCLELNVTD